MQIRCIKYAHDFVDDALRCGGELKRIGHEVRKLGSNSWDRGAAPRKVPWLQMKSFDSSHVAEMEGPRNHYSITTGTLHP